MHTIKHHVLHVRHWVDHPAGTAMMLMDGAPGNGSVMHPIGARAYAKALLAAADECDALNRFPPGHPPGRFRKMTDVHYHYLPARTSP